MSTVNLMLLVIGGIVLFIGVFSKWIREAIVSAPLIAFALGVILGPYVSGIFDLRTWGNQYFILEQASRFTLAEGLIGTALILPPLSIRFRWRTVASLLGVLTPIMWAITGLLIAFILRVPGLVALLAGASLAPTDPILARTITEGATAERNIPARIRYTLLEESGFNDGLGFPFVDIGIALATYPFALAALGHWAIYSVLLAVGGAVAVGIPIGYGASRLLHWSSRRHWVTRGGLLAYPIGLAFASLALATLLHIDGILVVFIVGLTFAGVGCPEVQQDQAEIQQTIDLFFTLPSFLLLGLAAPLSAWAAMGWPAFFLVLAVLGLRRLPPLMLLQPLLRGQIYTGREAAFAGWFGPMGLSAVFYGALVVEQTGIVRVWDIITLVVASSIVAHGISAAPLTRRFGQEERQEAAPEGSEGAVSR